MKFSVAMCTYNGSRYLGEQLESMAAQTRPPDELVVCDDCSTDCTPDLVRDFAARAPFPVRLHVNDRNLGIIDNFAAAIARCGGDLIALSDQDDVWLPDKLRQMEAIFGARPRAAGVFSDAEVVNARLQPLGFRLWPTFGFGRREQRMVRRGDTLRMLMPENCVTGATLAFRSILRPVILPIPKDTFWLHDGWIAVVLACLGDLVCIPEPLILYRQHEAQNMGARPPPDAPRRGIAESIALRRTYRSDHYRALARQFQQVHERVLTHSAELPVEARAISQLQAKIQHSWTRAEMPSSRVARVPLVMRELATLRYHLYSTGFRSAMKDLVY